MKILGINASPKGSKSQTLRLVQSALNGARCMGCEVELVDLCKLNIEYCNACGVCHKKGKCHKKDDFQALYLKMLAADGLGRKYSSADRGVLPAIGYGEQERMGARIRVLAQGFKKSPRQDPMTIPEISASPAPFKSLLAP